MSGLNEPTREPDARGAGDALHAPRSITELLVLWICTLGAAGILAVAGFLKLSGNEADIALFERIRMEPAGRILIGVLEMAAAGMMLIRQSSVQGALLGLGVMLGAILGHLTVLGLDKIQWAILVAVMCVAILFLRRNDATFIRNLFDR